MASSLTIITIYLITNTLVFLIIFILNSNDIKALKNKMRDLSFELKDINNKDNDPNGIIQESMADLTIKLYNVESYVTDIEQKIISLRTEIEIVKRKKKTTKVKTND